MDIDSLVKKRGTAPKTKLKIYPQDHRAEIDELLADILVKMWSDLMGSKINSEEMIFCVEAFKRAFITNLVDIDAIESIKSVFSKILATFSGNIDNVYRSQLLMESKMPEPGPTCIYIPDDIIAAAKKYIELKGAGTAADRKQAMAGLLVALGSYFTGLNAVYVVFDDENDFEKFKVISNQMLSQAGINELPEDFGISGKIFDGTILRKNYTIDNESNNPNSLARIMMAILTNLYPSRMLPTKTVESIIPSTLIFFNARQLSVSVGAGIQRVKREFEVLKSLDRTRILSFKEINSLEEMVRESERYNAGEFQLNSGLEAPWKSKAKEEFHITDINMSRTRSKLIKIEKHMKEVLFSRNPNREFEVETYQRPNRRDPLDPDLPGTYQELGCYPDIHLYVDTSGSITQKDYSDSVMMIIDIAKKMNCDIYFNSFSTVISRETLLKCRNRPKTAILKDISRIPKVTGGTAIDQVWSYISSCEKNRKQLSIIISDFFVDVPRYQHHPENLYYIPIKNPVKSQVESFTKNMGQTWRMLY